MFSLFMFTELDCIPCMFVSGLQCGFDMMGGMGHGLEARPSSSSSGQMSARRTSIDNLSNGKYSHRKKLNVRLLQRAHFRKRKLRRCGI